MFFCLEPSCKLVLHNVVPSLLDCVGHVTIWIESSPDVDVSVGVTQCEANVAIAKPRVDVTSSIWTIFGYFFLVYT